MPTHRQSIEGKSVALVDDFTTRDYSAECARNLPLQAAASKVVSLNVGKSRNTYQVISTING